METIKYCHLCDNGTEEENGVCLDCKSQFLLCLKCGHHASKDNIVGLCGQHHKEAYEVLYGINDPDVTIYNCAICGLGSLLPLPFNSETTCAKCAHEIKKKFEALGEPKTFSDWLAMSNKEQPGPPLTVEAIDEAVAKMKSTGGIPDYLVMPEKIFIGVKPKVLDSVAHPAHQCSQETCWCHMSPWYQDKPVVEV